MLLSGLRGATKALASIVLVVVALALGVVGAAPEAIAKDKPATTPAALPEPLTPETIRELVARLSDEQVRKLLIDQLDRAAAKTPVTERKAQGVIGMLEANAATAREGFGRLGAAALALPATVAAVWGRLTAPDGLPQAGMILVGLALMLGAGYLAERLFRRLVRSYRARLAAETPQTFTANAIRLALLLALDLAALAVFAFAAAAVFFAVWQGNADRRVLALGVLTTIVAIRATAVVAHFLLAPRHPERRLLPLDDAAARNFVSFAVGAVTLVAFLDTVVQVFRASGADRATLELFGVVGLALFLSLALWTVWRVREPVAALIRGKGESGTVAGWIADLWPFAAVVYIVVIALARLWELLTDNPGPSFPGAFSVLLLIALPVLDMLLCRALAAYAEAAPAEGKGLHGAAAAYQPVLRKLIHIGVVVVGLGALAEIWDIDLFAMAQAGLGARIAGALLGIGIVVLIAYTAWEVAKAAIDRRLKQRDGNVPGSTPSRLLTLLPLLRVTILITILVMAILSVLAALGVEILPLLAGAGVVGVAIGFGSQSLVRDIVSGAFFLMDDAFRVGEYIEVGDAKGRIEKLTVRSLFLRHHRGALNVLPYGQIARLRNTSRDWMIVILELRLAFDTDLKKVKKVLKTIGEEIAADPELGPDMIEPLKSQGVMATEDGALVVRAKYMAKPGDKAFLIRRMAYEKILKAFPAAGIQFAARAVSVQMPPGYESDERSHAIATAAAAAAAKAKPAGG